jgi:AcrR family transcriptional regulator
VNIVHFSVPQRKPGSAAVDRFCEQRSQLSMTVREAHRPPVSPRRARRRAARTDAFLDAAMRIVDRVGIEGLTVALLAAEVDAAVGALYRYFPGKDDLLAALQARALETLVLEMRRVRSRSPLDRLVKIVGVVATLPDRDPQRHRLLDELLSAPAPVYEAARARALDEHLARALGVVEEALAAAAAAALVAPGDAALRTRVLWALVHGASHLRKRDRLEPPALRQRRVERAALEAVLVGFGAERARVVAALRAWPPRRPA